MNKNSVKTAQLGITSREYDPELLKGSSLHEEMLNIVCQGYQGPRALTNLFLRKKIKLNQMKYYLLKAKFLIFQYFFISKLINIMIFLLEHNKVSKVHYLPFFFSLDVCNICNLHCPGCSTGLKEPSERKKGKITFKDATFFIDQIASKCIQVELCRLGESLLNKDFYSISAYAVKKGLWTVVHSNLCIRDKELARKIIDSKLHKLIVSCDGATQAIYEKYRTGGNIELVFENIKRIADEKKKRKVSFPWITAKFLIFDHNWQECKLFKEKALASGADEVLFWPAVSDGVSVTKKLGGAKMFNFKNLKWETPEHNFCYQIWENLFLDHDGGVMPCCRCFREEDLFVFPKDIRKMKIIEAWNVDRFRTTRRFFLGKLSFEKLPKPCNTCSVATDFLKNTHNNNVKDKKRC
jgi:MoaA/NifB/PqqE/SkfB family radical SAM enzyme